MKIFSALPVALLMILAASTLVAIGADDSVATAASDQQADDALADSLVDRWIRSVGGLEAYQSFQSASYTLATELYEPERGRLRRMRPRYVTIAKTPEGQVTRIERWEGNDFIVQTWDGETVRATLNGEPLEPGDKDYDETRYVSGDVHYWMGLPYKLRDPGVNLHYVGLEDELHTVGVSFGEGVGLHDGDQWRYWFIDGQTWPVKLAYREEGRENWNVLSFRDIREAGDYVFVGQRVHVDGDGQMWKILRTYDLEFNPEIPPTVFSQP